MHAFVLVLSVASAPGFLTSAVPRSMIPEANREGKPDLARIPYIGGLSLYSLMALTIK
jgi:hypothetical protein